MLMLLLLLMLMLMLMLMLLLLCIRCGREGWYSDTPEGMGAVGPLRFAGRDAGVVTGE